MARLRQRCSRDKHEDTNNYRICTPDDKRHCATHGYLSRALVLAADVKRQLGALLGDIGCCFSLMKLYWELLLCY